MLCDEEYFHAWALVLCKTHFIRLEQLGTNVFVEEFGLKFPPVLLELGSEDFKTRLTR